MPASAGTDFRAAEVQHEVRTGENGGTLYNIKELKQKPHNSYSDSHAAGIHRWVSSRDILLGNCSKSVVALNSACRLWTQLKMCPMWRSFNSQDMLKVLCVCKSTS